MIDLTGEKLESALDWFSKVQDNSKSTLYNKKIKEMLG